MVHWLYGCKLAAQAWENFYASKLEEVGFKRGDACGVVFHHDAKDLSCVCHGDDFKIVGEEQSLKWIASEMEKWFELKTRAVLGPDETDDKEVVILRRVVRWKEWGIEFEADPRHQDVLIEFFGFSGTSAAAAFNGDKEKLEDAEDKVDMDRAEAKQFRGLVARTNYLSQDAPDLQYRSKEISREMANPKRGAQRRLKKAMRYMLGSKAVIWRYE